MSRSYFREFVRGDEPEHPVDVAVDRRLPQRRLVRSIRTSVDRLLAALGDRRGLWLDLESLLNDRADDREATYFDVGYEHGLATARAEAQGRGVLGKGAIHLAAELRKAVLQANLPTRERLLALVEVAWVVVQAMEDET